MNEMPLSSSEITELTVGMNQLARNLWWTWNQEAQEVFQQLSPRGWQNLYHNAVAVLHEVSDYELRVRLQDRDFARQARVVLDNFQAYLKEAKTWGRENAPHLLQNPVAYFSAEFGFHETLPISAGGLGILAGDHAKSASDLGLGFVGVTLFYREGYFQQAVNQDNWQSEYYTRLNPRNLPIEPVLDSKGEPLVCTVEIAMNEVRFQAWRANVGRCPVYLLDTNRPENEQHYRDLTNCGVNRFQGHLRLWLHDLMGLGRVNRKDGNEWFCMTILALKLSRAANGVSELHGRVSRQMWQCLFPGRPADEVPIGHITNGVHLLGWMKGPVRRFWRRKIGPTWESGVNSPEFWQQLANPDFISDEEIWALRYNLRRELIEFCRRRLLIQGQRLAQDDFIAFDQLLNPDALTIGFARRFATYKRAPLVFQKFENVVKLVRDQQRPIQFIFAGKAHPRDDEGKRFIQHIIHLSEYSELKGYLVFIENYDVHVGRQMVSGCDVWLNNPRRPLEASGTSGMKANCHGCLNFSILDGWWREGYDGTDGFAIGDDSHPDSIEEQDRCDSENLYKTLTEEIIPCFFNRDADGIPRHWIQKFRRAMSTLVPQFNTWRMVQEYTRRCYLAK